MTREKAKALLPIIQAIIDGREIQVNLNGEWVDVDENHNCAFLPESYEYRVNPEPKYRPFNNAEECWQEMSKHQPFGWIKDKSGNKFIIENINSRGYVEVYDGTYIFKDIFKNYTFIDKTPFGIKE